MVSILVPVYGVEKYIERCAVSLFEQSYADIEYIFVDDSCKDNSISILHKIIEKYPSRLPYVHIVKHDRNRGLAAARNTAVKTASGDFIMHVDSDDYLELDAVEKLVEFQKKENADYVMFGMREFFSDHVANDHLPEIKSSKQLCLGQLSRKVRWCVCGGLYKRRLYVDNDVEAVEGINMGEDYSVTPKLAYYAQKVAVMQDHLYNYDHSNENAYTASFNEKTRRQDDESMIIERHFFEDKGPEYMDAWNEGWVFNVTRSLVILEKSGGGHDEYYAERCDCLDKIPKKYVKSLSRPFRIVYSLRHHRPLMAVYCKMAVFFKHLRDKRRR